MADRERIERLRAAVNLPASRAGETSPTSSSFESSAQLHSATKEHQTAISAPKRDNGGAVRRSDWLSGDRGATGITTDIRELVRGLDRLPPFIVARILLNDGDPLINLRKIIQSFNVDDRRDVVERLQQLPSAINDDFWAEWMHSCFPNVTSLPNGVATWRDAFRVAWLALANVQLIPANEEGENEVAQSSGALATWASTRAALDQSITCSQFVETPLRYTEEIDLETTSLLYVPRIHIGKIDDDGLSSGAFMNSLGDYLLDRIPIDNLDGTLITVSGEVETIEFAGDGNRPEISWNGFEYTGVQVETYVNVRLTLSVTPREFISDSLFRRINMDVFKDRSILENASLFLDARPDAAVFEMVKDQRPSLKRQL